jgi:hypothetical protein
VHQEMMDSTPTASEMPLELPSGMPSETQSEQVLETIFVSSSYDHGADLSQQFIASPRIESPESVEDTKKNHRSYRDRYETGGGLFLYKERLRLRVLTPSFSFHWQRCRSYWQSLLGAYSILDSSMLGSCIVGPGIL